MKVRELHTFAACLTETALSIFFKNKKVYLKLVCSCERLLNTISVSKFFEEISLPNLNTSSLIASGDRSVFDGFATK